MRGEESATRRRGSSDDGGKVLPLAPGRGEAPTESGIDGTPKGQAQLEAVDEDAGAGSTVHLEVGDELVELGGALAGGVRVVRIEQGLLQCLAEVTEGGEVSLEELLFAGDGDEGVGGRVDLAAGLELLERVGVASVLVQRARFGEERLGLCAARILGMRVVATKVSRATTDADFARSIEFPMFDGCGVT